MASAVSRLRLLAPRSPSDLAGANGAGLGTTTAGQQTRGRALVVLTTATCSKIARGLRRADRAGQLGSRGVAAIEVLPSDALDFRACPDGPEPVDSGGQELLPLYDLPAGGEPRKL